jgi:hypothetical protein
MRAVLNDDQAQVDVLITQIGEEWLEEQRGAKRDLAFRTLTHGLALGQLYDLQSAISEELKLRQRQDLVLLGKQQGRVMPWEYRDALKQRRA